MKLPKPMNQAYLEVLTTALRDHGAAFASGLTDGEITDIEAYHAFRFPPDLKALLQYALPISEGFVNWREYASDQIAYRVEEPFLGLLHAVEQGFWLRAWGEWPYNSAHALAIARAKLRRAPRLIPIYKHRYLPATPCLPGNPVLSVWASDIIHYGNDLADYFATEFRRDGKEAPEQRQRLNEPPLPASPHPEKTARRPRPVRFWDDIISAGP